MATCTSFEIELPKGSPYPSQCIKGNHVTSPDDSDMNYKFAEYEPTFGNSEQIAYRLNPNGYRYDSPGYFWYLAIVKIFVYSDVDKLFTPNVIFTGYDSKCTTMIQ